ncbi:glycoside hydrolase family 3 C-terminal domain-containing protein [Yinghuangia soli]|uniref:Exo-alpha-(1->6)-L-arabinopyranosidase n=1 Tax=Yinghuangia soli TaxID=2908204 RepID=A0AA41Q2E6_9ACTN|nr:glycoside hydrolase family 3 N-terminal domain-containing protein [Yinghuangia soli]MCF2528852.1 glycoside hydrolase family 3 C-terminal domain-containing protein [Yinghuangia soli]
MHDTPAAGPAGPADSAASIASGGTAGTAGVPGVRELTTAQKASLTSGADFWHLQGVEAAGIESVMVADGPHGLRKQPAEADPIGLGTSLPATCFPPAVGLASSWDTDLLRRVGEALGAEARAENVSVLLGPGVNIKRSPLCGRNFEYFSEDPFLAGRLGAAYVHGVQSQGVGTSLKHFAANNQETDRFRVSADIDERTLREIYLPAFEHVVKDAAPLTVMCAYNKVNGTYASEHHFLLTEVLRGEWGFDGLVVSDWGAVADRVKALAAGLDIEMPPSGTDAQIVAAVEDGRLTEEQLDAAARRVVTLIERTAGARVEGAVFDADAHHRLARSAALSSAVLLKNDGILPLDPAGTGRIAVIGEFARTPRYQGSGSSLVVPTRLDNALDAITALAGPERVAFAPGFALDGTPDPGLVADAVAAARDAEVAVLFLGLPAGTESEGHDRTHIDIPADQLALLAEVHTANPATVVVLSNGAAVAVADWQDRAAALLEGWLLGQAGGSATAELLFGLADPSGRLTETLPLRLADTPAHLHFPGSEQHVRYAEGLYVGYRYFDSLNAPVAYPFGHGLSYTTFELSGLSVVRGAGNTCTVTATVTNTGARTGTQTVQIYVHDPASSVDRPVHELKAFGRVTLAPGQSEAITLHLDERAFAYWSAAEHRWKVEARTVEVRAAFSSRDIRARESVELPGDGVFGPLTAMSSLREWLGHPIGGKLVGPLLEKLAAMRPPADGADAERGGGERSLPEMVAGLPLGKLAMFGAFAGAGAMFTPADLEALVAAVDREIADASA